LRSKVKGRSPGRSHNEWGFCNLDTTVALMAVK
jgi:hypothetical protein